MMQESIVFGGGCFWCTEAVFKRIVGITVTSGYAGGHTDNPSYEDVVSGTTGHAEVIRVEYDQAKVPLEHLLNVFFTIHDPTQKDRQGNDVGTQYRSIILFTTPEQEQMIRTFLERTQQGRESPIVTEVKKLESFWPAEQKHLDYYEKNKMDPYCIFVILPKLQKVRKEFGI
jgi:peptide-methionine (S)-S-oxide reductase